jgi:YHS domain-containing protein
MKTRSLTTLLRVPSRALAAAAVVLCSLQAFAVEPVNKDGDGLALHGYDPVAYFEQAKPVKGKAELTETWNGATWRFASEAHKERFAASPERFAPQYGGYCAKAVSENHTADVDPQAWKIVDGKLYLNYSPKVQKLWEEDILGRIARADANWPGLVGDNR